VLVCTGVTSKKDLWLYVLKVPVGTKEPFWLKGIERSKDREVTAEPAEVGVLRQSQKTS
jgi:hypothetical protein